MQEQRAASQAHWLLGGHFRGVGQGVVAAGAGQGASSAHRAVLTGRDRQTWGNAESRLHSTETALLWVLALPGTRLSEGPAFTQVGYPKRPFYVRVGLRGVTALT